MTSEEVKALVDAGIPAKRWQAAAQRVDLQKCLLRRPELRTYRDRFSEDEVAQFWLVLQQRPGDEAGGQVIYDEDRGVFGLAADGEVRGFYPSFLEAVDAM